MSPYATRLLLVLSSLTPVEEETRLVGQVFDEAGGRLEELTTKFRLQEVTPATTHQFETDLAEVVREIACCLTSRVYNSLEPYEAEQMPHDVHYEGGGYRRRNDKTRNAHVAMLFGTIELWRYAYRDVAVQTVNHTRESLVLLVLVLSEAVLISESVFHRTRPLALRPVRFLHGLCSLADVASWFRSATLE